MMDKKIGMQILRVLVEIALRKCKGRAWRDVTRSWHWTEDVAVQSFTQMHDYISAERTTACLPMTMSCSTASPYNIKWTLAISAIPMTVNLT